MQINFYAYWEVSLKKIVALNKVVGPGGLEPPTNGL